MRIWNVLPHPPPTILEVLSSDKPFTTAAPCNFYASYSPLAPGAATFTIRRFGEPNNPLKKMPVTLPPDVYLTMLVTNKDGQANVEVINDTIDPKAPDTGRLVIRQLFPNARVTVTVGTAAPTAPLNYGDVITVDSLPSGSTNLTMQAVIPGQTVKSWSIPLEMNQYHHNTLLIYPDPYGRFRPRLTVDGQAIVERGDVRPDNR